MLYIIFQYGVEPVLVQRIIIGFKAILRNGLSIDKSIAFIGRSVRSWKIVSNLMLNIIF